MLWSLGHRERRHLGLVARWVSRTGDGYLQVLVPGVAYLLGTPAAKLFALHFACAFAIERVLYAVLKNGLRRRRPPQSLPDFSSLIQASDRFSFPSGHTSAAFLMAALVFSAVPLLGALLFLWATAIAMSRVLLGVHFPSDTIAGAALGLSVSALPILPHVFV